MLKYNFVIICIIIFCVVLFTLLHKRKDLPFQEVVALDEAIAVVNARDWFTDNLNIFIEDEQGENRLKLHYGNDAICIQSNLQNDKKYKLTISRSDIKGKLLYKKHIVEVMPKKSINKYFVLIGASVGSDWHFDHLNKRVAIPSGFVPGFRVQYVFDKTESISKLCNMPFPVESVIIKECSAYFPRDLEKSLEQVKEWVNILRKKQIIPILATVVPVTKKQDQQHLNKFSSILAFNDAIRQFAENDDIIVLDLEKALRVSQSDRHLKNEYAQKDGTHLVAPAYERLDELIPLLTEKILKNSK